VQLGQHCVQLLQTRKSGPRFAAPSKLRREVNVTVVECSSSPAVELEDEGSGTASPASSASVSSACGDTLPGDCAAAQDATADNMDKLAIVTPTSGVTSISTTSGHDGSDADEDFAVALTDVQLDKLAPGYKADVPRRATPFEVPDLCRGTLSFLPISTAVAEDANPACTPTSVASSGSESIGTSPRPDVDVDADEASAPRSAGDGKGPAADGSGERPRDKTRARVMQESENMPSPKQPKSPQVAAPCDSPTLPSAMLGTAAAPRGAFSRRVFRSQSNQHML
jgi:hypothetical protein